MIKHAVYRILQGAKSIDVWDDYVATLKRIACVLYGPAGRYHHSDERQRT